jgi:Zn-dependent protease
MTTPDSASTCTDCGTEISLSLLSCPGCGKLSHAETLKELAGKAEQAALGGDLNSALAHWRRALDLLPPNCRQFETVQAKCSALTAQGASDSASARVESPPAAGPARHSSRGKTVAAGVTSLVLLIAGKAKFLFLGLTKAGTAFSMALSLGVYWTAWGWKFALGIVVSMYIHEIGHVAALARYGIRATAPTFIPGLGAFVRLKQHPATASQDARVGLAGPTWGLVAALGAYAVSVAAASASWAAIARVGAWINLLNLIPVWQLDGSRGFRALSRRQRWIVVLAAGGMYYLTREGLLILLVLLAALRSVEPRAPADNDPTALNVYLLLIIVLATMCRIKVPVQ